MRKLSSDEAPLQVHVGDAEDDNLWVQDQIRKGSGVGGTQPPPSAAHGAHASSRYPPGRGISKADAAAFAVTGATALATLQQHFQRLKATPPLLLH